MTSINNQTRDLFALDTVQDLDNETAAAIHGGAKIILYTDKNFQGDRLTVTANRAGQRVPLNGRFNNSISSAKVISGKWDLRSERDGSGGLGITLRAHRRFNFARNFDNVASLVIAKVA
jgi:hypothetical protein